MAQQVINIGASPGDGTGDALRVAFQKCNANFTELYSNSAILGTANTWALLQTFTSGIAVSANIALPATNSNGTAGVITLNGSRFIHNPTNNLFIGVNAGNFSLTGPEAFENLGVGGACLASLTSGGQNTAINQLSLTALTTGSNNIAVGYNTLPTEVTGGNNTAVGTESLLSQNGASGNTALGFLAGADVTTGGANTFIGNNTGRGITTGQQNTILGANVGGLSSTLSNAIIIADSGGNIQADYGKTVSNAWTFAGGFASINLPTTTSLSVGTIKINGQSFASVYHNNLFVGQVAGNFTLTGTGNNALGTSVFSALTTGNDNASQGNGSSAALTTGSNNAALGTNALATEATGNNNVALGKNALLVQNGAGSNIAVGFQAGAGVTTGNNNIIIGNNTAGALTTGSQNTLIGGGLTVAATLSNAIVIADGVGNIRLDYNKTTANLWAFSANVVVNNPTSASVTANCTTAGQQSLHVMQDAGVNMWGVFKNTDNSFGIFDYTAATFALTIANSTKQIGFAYQALISASTTTRSGLRMSAGTAPASPINGDIWFDGTNLKMQIGGVTKTFTLT